MITTEFSFCHITIKLRVGNAPELVQPASGDAAELHGEIFISLPPGSQGLQHVAAGFGDGR